MMRYQETINPDENGTRRVSTCPALQRLDSRGRIQNRNQVAHDI